MDQTQLNRILQAYIEQHTVLPREAWQALTVETEPFKLSKEERITNAALQHFEYFVAEGVVHFCERDQEGKEHSLRFYASPNFLSYRLIFRKPLPWESAYYQALTDVVGLRIVRTQFNTFIHQFPAFKALAANIKEAEYEHQRFREEMILRLSTEQRYLQFGHFFPGLENEIPHYRIASYLGMTPVSLSRIRGRRTR